jgi:uncharacterized membrane protein
VSGSGPDADPGTGAPGLGHGHGHGALTGGAGPSASSIRRFLALALLPFAAATVAGLVLLWPTHRFHPSIGVGQPPVLIRATVTTVARCAPAASGCETVGVRIDSGPDDGHSEQLADVTLGQVPTLHRGDKVLLGRIANPQGGPVGQVQYYFVDFQRSLPLGVLALLFAVAVVGVARWRGLAALAGLVVTWAVLVWFVIPDLLLGKSPVAVALVGAAAIMFVVVYLAHGLSTRTTTALLGTLASLALTGLLAALFVPASHLTGLQSEEAGYLQSVVGNISWSGLLLAGTVIGALGVLNDVTVTQASAVWELHAANPLRTGRDLYRSALRIGRDHIASTVYTLVFAYAGASLPLLILFTLSNQGFTSVVTGEVVAEEIVRTLVGSVGLVASVPITTALATFVVTRPPAQAKG